MLSVSLSGVRFHAPIGLYPQESYLHNEIEINMTVSVEAAADNLPLIDYTVLHAIARQAVDEPAQLLETIVQRIARAVAHAYPGARTSISVRKHNPPMAGIVAHAEVKWES